MRAVLHILIPLAILGLGYWAYNETIELKESGFKLNKKKSAQTSTRKKGERPKIRTRAMLLEKGVYTVHLQTQGVIRPHNTTTLTPQVGGRVTYLSPHFEDGAYFNKGDILLKLDTADFLTDLESAKAQLARSEAAYAQEQARAKQALLNWNDAGFEEEASDLVLRKPQLREAEANVSSAQSSLEKAERNLSRTQVKAPYDGRVRKRNIGLGQQVGASTALGEVFSTDFAEVRLPLTTRDLTYYEPPSKPGSTIEQNNILFDSPISSLTPSNTSANDQTQWVGSILRAEGALDEDSKQLFVIARIDDPFGLTTDKTPLFIGQPVRANIPAHTLKGVYTIPRSNLSGLNEILVIREGLLTRVNFTPIWSSSDTVITREGIESGDLLCTTRLPYAPEGAPVEIIPEPEADNKQANRTEPGDSRRVGRKRKRPSK